MAISEKRVDLKTQTTNVATKDFTQIKDNKTINKKEEGNDLLDKIKGSIGDSADKLAEVKDAVMSGINDAQSGLSKVTESIKSGIDQAKGVIETVKGAAKGVMTAVNNAKAVASAVERVCKDPSLSSLSALGGSISGLTNSIPGLASGPMSKLADLVPESISQGLSSVASNIGEGVSNFVSSSGLKNVVDAASSTIGEVTKSVSSITGMVTSGITTVTNTINEAEKIYTGVINSVNSLGIPGVVLECSKTPLIDKIGLSKAINNTLNCVNGINSVTTFIETSRSNVANTFSCFAPSSTSKVTEDYGIENCNYNNNTAATIIRDAQLNIDQNTYTSDDGIFSSKSSTGNNFGWTIASTISSSISSKPDIDNNGVVKKTSNEQLAAVAEITKSAEVIENKTARKDDLNKTTYTEIEKNVKNNGFSIIDTSSIDNAMSTLNKYKTKEPEKVEEKKKEELNDFLKGFSYRNDIDLSKKEESNPFMEFDFGYRNRN